MESTALRHYRSKQRVVYRSAAPPSIKNVKVVGSRLLSSSRPPSASARLRANLNPMPCPSGRGRSNTPSSSVGPPPSSHTSIATVPMVSRARMVTVPLPCRTALSTRTARICRTAAVEHCGGSRCGSMTSMSDRLPSASDPRQAPSSSFTSTAIPGCSAARPSRLRASARRSSMVRSSGSAAATASWAAAR
jgi:hypothetical protein